MKPTLHKIIIVLVVMATFEAANTVKALSLNPTVESELPIPNKFKMNYGIGAGFGVRNSGLFLETGVQIYKRFTLGGTIGLHHYNYKLYSSSDLHEIRMMYFPYMAKASVIFYENPNCKFFIYGRYGQVWKRDREGVTHTKPNSTITWEAGVGAEFRGNVPVQIFLGQTYTNGMGNLESTYNSSIDFEMDIYNFFLGASISLFSNR